MSSPRLPIRKNVTDEHGHEHGSDGRFVCTGGCNTAAEFKRSIESVKQEEKDEKAANGYTSRRLRTLERERRTLMRDLESHKRYFSRAAVDARAAYPEGTVFLNGTEKVVKDDQTYYEISWGNTPKPERKFGEYMRDKFVSNPPDGGNEYFDAKRVLEALTRGSDEKPEFFRVSDEDWGEFKSAFNKEKAKAQKQWDERNPEGGNLFRGLRPHAYPKFVAEHPVGSIIDFGLVTSTSADKVKARDFIDGFKAAREGEYMKPGGGILNFTGVKGKDITLSSSSFPQAFTLPTRSRYGVCQYESEAILSNTRKWRVASIKPADASGYAGEMTLEPADDLEKRFRLSENVDLDMVDRFIRKVRDDEGHEHGSDGRFVSTGGGEGGGASLEERQAAHEEKYGKKAGKEIVDCGRCNGTGRLGWAEHVENGRCFSCDGKKKVTVTISQPKVLAARAEKEAERVSQAQAESLLREYETRQRTPELYDRLSDRAAMEREASKNAYGYAEGGVASQALNAWMHTGMTDEAVARALRVAEQKLIDDGHLSEGDITDPSRNGKGYKRAEGELNSKHIGSPGEKMTRTLKLDRPLIQYENNYGTGYIAIMSDEDGNRIKWFTSSPYDVFGDGYKPGDPFKADFTVKEHGRYDGVDETTVLRVRHSKEKPPRNPRKSGPPLPVRKIKDDEGHEHASDGKFTSGAGGSAAPKIPKPKREKIDYETVNTYMHPQSGARIPMHHAGGSRSWGGKHSDVAQDTFGGQFQRWDESLPDIAEHPEEVTVARAFIANVRADMGRRIADLEDSVAEKMPKERSAMRQANKALYFDRNRAKRALMAPAYDEDAIVHLQKTAALAKMIAEKKPKSVYDTINLYEQARESDSSLPELQRLQMAREHILYRFGVDARNTLEGAIDQKSRESMLNMFNEVRPSVKDMADFEWAMNKTWGDLGMSAEMAPMMLGKTCANIGQPYGAAIPDGSCIVIACSPSNMPMRHGELPEAAYVNAVAHEMAHLISHVNFDHEMRSFSNMIDRRIETVGMASAEQRSSMGLSPEGYRMDDFITRHGWNMKDQDRTQPLDGAQGDFQEDWAIGLSECVFGAKPGGMRTSVDLPAYESVELLCKLFSVEPKKSSYPMSKLKHFPSKENPRGLPDAYRL